MKKILNYLKKINYKDVIIFIIPFLIFSIVLYIYNPGILSYDSYNQLNQISSGNFENWHPFFHTFIEMLCLKVWNSPVSIAFFQILVFSSIWTAICKYNRKKNTKKEFFTQILITFFIVVNPINSIYSITLWKDILFSYSVLLFAFLIEIMVDKDFKVSKKFILFIAFVMAFMAKIRHNGLYVAVIMLIILTIILYLKNKKKSKIFLVFPIMFIIFMLLFSSLDKIYNVKDNEKSAINTKIMHILGFYEAKGFIDEKDNKLLSKIIDTNELKEEYNAYFLDPIYNVTDNNMANKYQKDIIKMSIKYSVKHPIDFLKYSFKSSTIVWQIVCPDDMIGGVFYTNINSVNNTANITAKNIDENFYKNFDKIINNTLNNEFSNTIFYSSALYFYITLLIVIINIFKYKNCIKSLLIILPNFLSILIVAVSIPVQDTRYLYPNFLMLYLFLIILNRNIFSGSFKEEIAK